MASSPNLTQAFTIRPTSKFAIFSYLLTIGLMIAAAGVWYQRQARREFLYAIIALGALRLLMTAKNHARLRFTALSFDGQGLRFQDGFVSKSTRMINMSKIQDVRVDQGLVGRLLGIGTITFETAGETGRLVMENVDQPQEVANRILALTHPGAGTAPPRT